MSSKEVMNKPSIRDQLGEETLRLSQRKFLEKKVRTTNKSVSEIIGRVCSIRDYLKKEKEPVKLKERGYTNLATWWLQRLPLNGHNSVYFRRFDPIVKKSTPIITLLKTFDLKFKQAEQKLKSMESDKIYKSEIKEIDSDPFSFKQLEAEVVQIEARITRAVEVKQAFLDLEKEWIIGRQNIISDLDDCIYKVNALIQETYVHYGDLN